MLIALEIPVMELEFHRQCFEELFIFILFIRNKIFIEMKFKYKQRMRNPSKSTMDDKNT